MTLPLDAASRAAARPRPCLYRPAHKGLRLALGQVTARFGALDLADDADLAAAVAELKALCGLMHLHMAKEDTFLHAPLEAVRPGGAGGLPDEHGEEAAVMARLVAATDGLARLPAEQRAPAAHTLYLDLARWTAAVLLHADREEREVMPRLQAQWDDAALVARLHGIVAAFETAELDAFLRWMLPALRPQERLMLGTVIGQARGAAALPALVALAARVLEPPAVRALAEGLGVAPPEAPCIVVFEFPFAGPFGDAMTEALAGLARDIAQEPGLLWKVWTEDAAAGTAGGVYAFAGRTQAEAYAARHAARLEGFGITGIRCSIQAANPVLSALDNARFLPAA